jgi:hypothetical protein
VTSNTGTTIETADTTGEPALSPRRAGVVRGIGVLAIAGGVAMVIVGGAVWGMVSSQLAAEKITVSEDSSFLAGANVTGPFSAFAQATIINHHALEASGGKTYAELDQDDPTRQLVMNASFLRASLFTSVVSFGVAAFAIGAGVLIGLVGWALTAVAPRSRNRIG